LKFSYSNSQAEISINRLLNNLKVLQSQTQSNTKSMAVVKADAYGHGAVEVCNSLEKEVDWLAVANVDEGIELRQAGIRHPILIFGVPDKRNAGVFREFNLVATVSAFDHFNLLPEGTTYHLNFDSGMGRYGFLPDEVEKVQKAINTHEELNCTGIYSHFATADEPDSTKAREQLAIFEQIRSRFDDSLIIHMANSGGVAFYQNSHFDMVRYGIGLYGYPPGNVPIKGLEPVLKWKSHLAQVKRIKKENTVSYLATWEAPEDGYIGVIPVGYADGLPRNLSHRLEVEIEGKIYPVVGIITMDNIMVYLGDDKLPVDSEVTLLGRNRNTARDWAEKLGTISYEILCRFTRRVERVYVDCEDVFD